MSYADEIGAACESKQRAESCLSWREEGAGAASIASSPKATDSVARMARTRRQRSAHPMLLDETSRWVRALGGEPRSEQGRTQTTSRSEMSF
eukprot:2519822-Rhodomonas_salina.3